MARELDEHTCQSSERRAARCRGQLGVELLHGCEKVDPLVRAPARKWTVEEGKDQASDGSEVRSLTLWLGRKERVPYRQRHPSPFI